MRVLHVVKTADGARWAALQALILNRLGVEIHVVLPSATGEAVPIWQRAEAEIHIADVSLPVRNPWRWPDTATNIRRLVDEVKPDIIHSHFVTTTLALRLALKGHYPNTPRIFQVPGPLHLEHAPYREADLRTAGPSDYWIASSRCIQSMYAKAGVSPDWIFLSYYGTNIRGFETNRSGTLREKLGIPVGHKVVGNISFMYPPKYFLGQTTGLKRHEDVIDALGLVCRQRPDVVGLLVGGQWPSGTSYRKRLQDRAKKVAGNRIIFVDRVHSASVGQLWAEFDCVVHVPISENCGGVIEPLAAAVPTIASRVGGLPEVIVEGETGWLVPPKNPGAVAEKVLEALAIPEDARRRAEQGRRLVLEMFDVERTGSEVFDIYRHILGHTPERPRPFDSSAFVQTSAGANGKGPSGSEMRRPS